jgi:rhamnose transport system permease protein
VQTVVLWNTRDLGYLTVRAAADLVGKALRAGATSLQAARLGVVQVRGSEIILGEPLRFTKANIDLFDF